MIDTHIGKHKKNGEPADKLSAHMWGILPGSMARSSVPAAYAHHDKHLYARHVLYKKCRSRILKRLLHLFSDFIFSHGSEARRASGISRPVLRVRRDAVVTLFFL